MSVTYAPGVCQAVDSPGVPTSGIFFPGTEEDCNQESEKADQAVPALRCVTGSGAAFMRLFSERG